MRGYIALVVVVVTALVGTTYAGNYPGGGHGGGFGGGHGRFGRGPGGFGPGPGGFGPGPGGFNGGHGRYGGGHGRYGGDYGGGYGPENYGPPMPYQFGYSSEDSEGTHGHSQQSDGRRVQGHYVIQLADGRHRRVDYTADETGFHAKVNTNELGTESKNAADAIYESSAIPGDQAAVQNGPGPRGPYGGDGHHGGPRGAPHGGRGFGPGNYNRW